jgi:hypothetical protein
MTLGIALILIFVLYLIDKHNRWRQAIKITVALIILGIVGIGGMLGWEQYEIWHDARQEAQRAAAEAKQVAQEQAELAKTCKAWEDKHPLGSPLDILHGKADDGTNLEGAILGPLGGCHGPLETAYNSKAAVQEDQRCDPKKDPFAKIGGRLVGCPPLPLPVHVRRVRALYGIDLTTKELGELKCGAVKAGDVVILLEDGRVNGLRVKTSDGQIGWAPESMFEVVQ